MEQYNTVFGTDNPDLTAFRDRGGKVVIWHGWADQLISSEGTVDYYKRLQERMGGAKKTLEFARLFMAPGVGHCGGGTGPTPTGQLDARRRKHWQQRARLPGSREPGRCDNIRWLRNTKETEAQTTRRTSVAVRDFSVVSKSDFETLLAPLFERIRNSALNDSLERALNEGFPMAGAFCQSILEACRQGDAGGWVCEREAAGIRYGRVIKPGPSSGGFSVDVVQMRDIVGPHHVHPNGEIDLILPTEGSATFDQRPAGGSCMAREAPTSQPWKTVARTSFTCCPAVLSTSLGRKVVLRTPIVYCAQL